MTEFIYMTGDFIEGHIATLVIQAETVTEADSKYCAYHNIKNLPKDIKVTWTNGSMIKNYLIVPKILHDEMPLTKSEKDVILDRLVKSQIGLNGNEKVCVIDDFIVITSDGNRFVKSIPLKPEDRSYTGPIMVGNITLKESLRACT